MELTAEQQQQVAAWVRGGDGPAQVQTKIEETFGVRMTFMEVRFLIDDLELDLVDATPAAPEKKNGDDDVVPFAEAEAELVDEPGGPGKVSVSVDAVMRPGAMVSGSVTFSDGETVQWQVDQLGQLGLIPSREGYQPSSEDIQEFQMQLQQALSQKGF